MARISTQNGKEAHRAHNIRDEKVVAKLNHIDKNGHYEVWHDENIREAYGRLFGSYVEEYNRKQKRKERKIDNYFDKVKNSRQQNPMYEIIIGVYGDDVSDEDRYDVLRKYYETWSSRNPNLELVGAYYHADEEGEPHLHIDYVPVGHGFKNGMSVRNSLSKAMDEMGFVKMPQDLEKEYSSENKFGEAQWSERENEFLEKLCLDKNITIEHPRDEEKHLKTKIYKLVKQVESLDEEISVRQSKIVSMENKFNALSSEIESYSDGVVLFNDLDENIETFPLPYKNESALDYHDRIMDYNEDIFVRFHKMMEEKSSYLKELERQKAELDDMKLFLKRHDYTFDDIRKLLDRLEKIEKASRYRKNQYRQYIELERKLYAKGKDIERFHSEKDITG